MAGQELDVKHVAQFLLRNPGTPVQLNVAPSDSAIALVSRKWREKCMLLSIAAGIAPDGIPP